MNRRITSRLLAIVCAALLFSSLAIAQTGGDKSKKGGATSADDKGGKKGAAPKKLDINAASKDDLDALPGIGAAYSQKIIDGRPYGRKDDLVKCNIIPKATYDKIADQIIAHGGPKGGGCKGAPPKAKSKKGSSGSTTPPPK